jgi:hypothetical protein
MQELYPNTVSETYAATGLNCASMGNCDYKPKTYVAMFAGNCEEPVAHR